MESRIDNESFWVENTDPSELVEQLSDTLADAGHLVLHFHEHHFHPQGFTALWLLGESHLAVHTFPENGNSYIELSSCNHEKNVNFMFLIHERLNICLGSRSGGNSRPTGRTFMA